MPLSSETIANRPLSGTELKERIKADVEMILNRDGIFSPYLAYGKLAYTITIDFQLSNPMMPKHKIEFEVGEVDPTSADSIGLELKREITSPNAERVALGLPVKVHSTSGHTTDITYPPEILTDRVEPKVEQVAVRKRGRPKGSGLATRVIETKE